MITRDQERALKAHQHIGAIARQEPTLQQKYRSLVMGLPALLRTAGPCQTLHFIASRKGDERHLVLHLAEQLSAPLKLNGSGQALADALLDRARRAETEEYLLLSRELLSLAAWYRRLAQILLSGGEGGE